MGYEYDFVVIGGGSGGMAAAKEAARLGAKVALFDFVKPTVHGTKWGLGGTCVNVGCVPKKIMHYSSLLGAGLHDAAYLGWQLPSNVQHNWETMVDAVQSHVKKLNFSYRVGLRSNKVQYINALARFQDPHTIAYELKNGPTQTLTAQHILIATGGRPTVPADVPGAKEYAITSDDLFSLQTPPGKTLVVGGSYIALECAGFLHELKYPTTVAVRSILLRGFDRQAAAKIQEVMVAQGMNFRFSVLPTSITKNEATGKLHVALRNSETNETFSEEFDTVLYAVGRTADTFGLGLENTGVVALPNGKFDTVNEATNVPHIHAVGDVLQGKPELTPVAIRAGEYLVRRIFGNSTKTMNYDLVPTTVFTPVEYGTIGLSEEEAIARYGKEDIVVYPWEFQTLEWGAVHRQKAESAREGDYDIDFPANCLSKLICLKSANEKVIGFHFVGPNAGEVTQGFAVAVAMGATKEDFDNVVGIHPTDAESFQALTVTKESGASWVASGGCGGGVCG
ncbi:thioredoxin reductase [Thraustotheca clavata]|uniref:Thioredoxin reductase n=1 Tax=Thraustotheca clavata TaxID=74557 RepID=A0A1W0ABH6_9STRA|nr:thioredoxin reductase [Thraustotheca clavata]